MIQCSFQTNTTDPAHLVKRLLSISYSFPPTGGLAHECCVNTVLYKHPLVLGLPHQHLLRLQPVRDFTRDPPSTQDLQTAVHVLAISSFNSEDQQHRSPSARSHQWSQAMGSPYMGSAGLPLPALISDCI